MLFGHRLPAIARNLGMGVRNFKKEMGSSEDKNFVDDGQAQDTMRSPLKALPQHPQQLSDHTSREGQSSSRHS